MKDDGNRKDGDRRTHLVWEKALKLRTTYCIACSSLPPVSDVSSVDKVQENRIVMKAWLGKIEQ